MDGATSSAPLLYKEIVLIDTTTQEELRCKKLIIVGNNGEEVILRVATEPAVRDSLDNHVIREAITRIRFEDHNGKIQDIASVPEGQVELALSNPVS
jgi:predicted lipoprotein